MNSTDNTLSRGDIAIVGMSVTVPGAEGIDAYWANLREGVSALKRRDAAELRAAGESAERMALWLFAKRRRHPRPAAPQVS